MVSIRNTKHPRVLMMMTTNGRSLYDTARCKEALMKTMRDCRSSDEYCQVQRSLSDVNDEPEILGRCCHVQRSLDINDEEPEILR